MQSHRLRLRLLTFRLMGRSGRAEAAQDFFCNEAVDDVSVSTLRVSRQPDFWLAWKAEA